MTCESSAIGYEAVLRARERHELQYLERNRQVLRRSGGVTDSSKTNALHVRYTFRTPWMGGPDVQDYQAHPWLDDDGQWKT